MTVCAAPGSVVHQPARFIRHTWPGGGVRTGGAEAFLNFIEEKLKPLVATRTRIDAAHQVIFGHSFGGLFVLCALCTRPAAFRGWIAISPAIWLEQYNLLRFAAAPEGAVRVFLGVGEYEQALAPFQIGALDESERRRRQEEARRLDEIREMAERLSGYGKPAAINRAIRFACGPQAAPGS